MLSIFIIVGRNMPDGEMASRFVVRAQGPFSMYADAGKFAIQVDEK